MTIKVKPWMNNYIPRKIMYVIAYLCLRLQNYHTINTIYGNIDMLL